MKVEVVNSDEVNDYTMQYAINYTQRAALPSINAKNMWLM